MSYEENNKLLQVQPHRHELDLHSYSHKTQKVVINRMARIIGHLESVKRMVEQERDCSEVLIQLAAVNSAVHSVSRVILKEHIQHCLVDAVKNNDEDTIKQLNAAIDKMFK